MLVYINNLNYPISVSAAFLRPGFVSSLERSPAQDNSSLLSKLYPWNHPKHEFPEQPRLWARGLVGASGWPWAEWVVCGRGSRALWGVPLRMQEVLLIQCCLAWQIQSIRKKQRKFLRNFWEVQLNTGTQRGQGPGTEGGLLCWKAIFLKNALPFFLSRYYCNLPLFII